MKSGTVADQPLKYPSPNLLPDTRKRTQLDCLYQKVVDDLDELLHALGLKVA